MNKSESYTVPVLKQLRAMSKTEQAAHLKKIAGLVDEETLKAYQDDLDITAKNPRSFFKRLKGSEKDAT